MKKALFFVLILFTLGFVSCKSEKIEYKNYEKYEFRNRVIVEEASFTFDMDEMTVQISEIQHSFPTDLTSPATQEEYSKTKVIREGNPLENGYISLIDSEGLEELVLIEDGKLSNGELDYELIKNGKKHKKIDKLFKNYSLALEEMKVAEMKKIAEELRSFEQTPEWNVKDAFEFYKMNDFIKRMETN